MMGGVVRTRLALSEGESAKNRHQQLSIVQDQDGNLPLGRFLPSCAVPVSTAPEADAGLSIAELLSIFAVSRID
jgi:hypothetical protein